MLPGFALTHVEDTLSPLFSRTLACCSWDQCLVPSLEVAFTLVILKLDSGASICRVMWREAIVAPEKIDFCKDIILLFVTMLKAWHGVQVTLLCKIDAPNIDCSYSRFINLCHFYWRNSNKKFYKRYTEHSLSWYSVNCPLQVANARMSDWWFSGRNFPIIKKFTNCEVDNILNLQLRIIRMQLWLRHALHFIACTAMSGAGSHTTEV